jgi:hypothetical protein
LKLHKIINPTFLLVIVQKGKKPRSLKSGVSPFNHKQCYMFPRLDALIGLSLAWLVAEFVETWVARLQLPFFHFMVGSGHTAQYQPLSSSDLRLQPSHCSMTSWQNPPLYVQPLAVIKEHS